MSKISSLEAFEKTMGPELMQRLHKVAKHGRFVRMVEKVNLAAVGLVVAAFILTMLGTSLTLIWMCIALFGLTTTVYVVSALTLDVNVCESVLKARGAKAQEDWSTYLAAVQVDYVSYVFGHTKTLTLK